MIECLGCGSIKLRVETWSSEHDIDEHNEVIPSVSYYPPAVFRSKPRWLFDLIMASSLDDGNIYDLLTEIYVALQNDQRALAAMGIRALLENVIIGKVSDHGTFSKNLMEFEKHGYISRMQRERLETILEAGHAAIHRRYKPSKEDLITLVDISESLIESIYIHGTKVDKLKNGIPNRTHSKK